MEKMMYCGKCGTKNLEVAKFCKNCGKKNDKISDHSSLGKSCKSCGEGVFGDENFCKSCGHFIEKAVESSLLHMSNMKLFFYIAGIFFLIFIISEMFSGHHSMSDMAGTLIGAFIVALMDGFDMMRAWRR